MGLCPRQVTCLPLQDARRPRHVYNVDDPPVPSMPGHLSRVTKLVTVVDYHGRHMIHIYIVECAVIRSKPISWVTVRVRVYSTRSLKSVTACGLHGMAYLTVSVPAST